MEATYQKLCDAGDVGENQTIEVEMNEKNILVSKIDGEFFAVENRCTHEGLPLTGGKIYQGQIQCPHHGAIFDFRNGKAVGFPAVVDLKTYKVKIEDNNVLAAL